MMAHTHHIEQLGRSPRVLIAGGGTGGHAYPAIAIADAIRDMEPDAVIAFAGSRSRIEWRIVPEAGYPIHEITVQGLARKWTLQNVLVPFRLGRGLAQSHRLVRDFDPDVVVGTGGFVSLPVTLAARASGRRILIQEQNAAMGLANRIAARFADRIHVAFSECIPSGCESRSTVSGNPVRAALIGVDRSEARGLFGFDDEERVLLVFGGSLGSRAINDAMLRHAGELLDIRGMWVIWQTGSLYYERVRERTPEHSRLRLLRYIDRMDLAYAAADLALCRAGASTCSELLATGTPSLLVPSPNVAGDHQTKNALGMSNAGAAEMLPEGRLMDDLPTRVAELIDHPARLDRMRRAALDHARVDAARDIANDALRLAGGRVAA